MMELLRQPASLDIDWKFFCLTVGATQVFFWILYFITEKIMDGRKDLKECVQLTSSQKADYISRIIANIHAIISAVLSYIALFYCWYKYHCY